MQKLPEFKAAYDWFFNQYEREVEQLARDNDLTSIEKMDSKRDALERAFFIIMFAQFERAVKSAFISALESRKSNPDWSHRRGWDTSALNGKKVPFETQLALVLDSMSPSYKQVLTSYNQRNHCAHGGTTDPIGSIDLLEANLYRWQSELRT